SAVDGCADDPDVLPRPAGGEVPVRHRPAGAGRSRLRLQHHLVRYLEPQLGSVVLQRMIDSSGPPTGADGWKVARILPIPVPVQAAGIPSPTEPGAYRNPSRGPPPPRERDCLDGETRPE